MESNLTLLTIFTSTLWDLKTRRIPNALTFSAIVLGFALGSYYSGLEGIKNSFLGMVTGLLLLIIPFALGGMGAGDVKLLAAVGAMNGPIFVFYAFLYSAVAGGVFALIVAALRGQMYTVIFNAISSLQALRLHFGSDKPEIMTSNIRFPYGISIFIGTLTAYWLR